MSGDRIEEREMEDARKRNYMKVGIPGCSMCLHIPSLWMPSVYDCKVCKRLFSNI